jgi:hypothetical protein
MCISWTNKEFDIINARCKSEDYVIDVAMNGNWRVYNEDQTV